MIDYIDAKQRLEFLRENRKSSKYLPIYIIIIIALLGAMSWL